MSAALVPYAQGHGVEMEDQDEEGSQMSSVSSLPSKKEEDADEASKTTNPKRQFLATKGSGVDEACLLVQAILEQVTLNDSPPANDEIPVLPATTKKNKSPRHASHASTTTKSTGSSYTRPDAKGGSVTSNGVRFSRQRHVWQPLEDVPSPTSDPGTPVSNAEPLDAHSLEATSTLSSIPFEMENDPAALWMMHYKRSQTRSEMKMGNVALATLCTRTLDSISPHGDGTAEDAENESKEASSNEPVSTTGTGTAPSRKEAVLEAAPQIDDPSGPQLVNKKKSWLSRRRWKKKHGGIPAKLHVPSQNTYQEGTANKSENLGVETIKVVADGNDDFALRELDNLPPTPVRTNTKRFSGENAFNENNSDPEDDDEGAKDNDEAALDVIEQMRSGDDEDEDMVHMLAIGDADLVLESRSEDEDVLISPPGVTEENTKDSDKVAPAEDQFLAMDNDMDAVLASRSEESDTEVESRLEDEAAVIRPPATDAEAQEEDQFYKMADEMDAVLASRSEESDTEVADGDQFHMIPEDMDVVLASRSEEEIAATSPSADMENIQEETDEEVAREVNGEIPVKPEESRASEKAAPLLFNSTGHSPTGKPPTPPSQGRIQMYGSEYARFLSSTAFSPQVQRRRSSPSKPSLPRKLSSSRNSKSHGISSIRSVNIEDAKDPFVTGAVTDILVTHGNEVPPKGYFRISQTGSGEDFTALRTCGAKGRKTTPVFLNVKKECSWDKAAQRPCVTALALIFPDRKEFVPPGFCVVRRYKVGMTSENASAREFASPANLNHGSSGERVYLCYRRSREGNPITGIIPLQPSMGESIPEGYTVLERTPRNFVADMNAKGDVPVFLAFRQRLANLETLRPLPLVLSVHFSQSAATDDAEKAPVRPSSGKKRLRAYFCTGGTVVPSDVGRFHIMDRSTHSLLSPSSVSNRISLIEASRKQHSSIDCADLPKATSSSTYASSVGGESREKKISRGRIHSTPSGSVSEYGLTGDGSILTNGSSSFMWRMSKSSSDMSQKKSHSRDHSLSSLSEVTLMDGPDESNTSSFVDSMSASHPSIFSHEDIELQSCFDAMDFIPSIEYAEVAADTDDRTHNIELLQSRVAVLTPILTACYTHHGGSALVAVEGLHKLLTKTDFFKPDIATSPDALNGISSRLTLLDLAVQAVCDVATSSARETSFGPCVEFIESAVQYSKGHLNTRTIGYTIRFYLFVFYFGASVPAASSSWPMARKVNAETGTLSYVMNDVALLHEEAAVIDIAGSRPLFPGGAPQASALALKELISLTIVRLRQMSYGESDELESIGKEITAFAGAPEGQDDAPDLFSGLFIKEILGSIMDGATNCVDLANHTQLALHQMHRSGGSELFWHDMISACGVGLFGSDVALGSEGQQVYTMSFAFMANLVKVSSTKMRRMSKTSEFVPRDISSKLLGLELLLHFLEKWGQAQSTLSEDDTSIKSLQAVNTMTYSIRRLVIPCLLWNTESGIENSRVFRRLIRIVSELWCTPHFRSKMKMELGVLIEHFVLRVIQLGPQLGPTQPSEHDRTGGSSTSSLTRQTQRSETLLQNQVEILLELKKWFVSGQHGVIELFLNFDLDFSPGGDGPSTRLMPGPQWKISQQLCAALCAIAEQSADTIGAQIRVSQTTGVGPPSPRALSPEKGIEMASVREGGRLLQQKAFATISQVVKSLAESAATASGKRYRRLVNSWTISGGDSDEDDAGSILSDDDESIGSVGNIHMPSPRSRVLGIRKREILLSPRESAKSPRSRSHSPQKRSEIVDYWQNSIAPDRKKAMMSSSPRGRSVSPIRRVHTPEANVVQGQPSESPGVGDATNSLFNKAPKDEVAKGDIENLDDQDELPNTEETLDVAFKLVEDKGMNKALNYLIACNFLTPSPRDIASFLRIHSSRLDATVLGNYLGEGGQDGSDIEYRNLIRFNYFRAISFVGMNIEEGLRYFLTNCGFRLPGEAQKIDRVITTFSQCYWEDNAGDLQRCPFQDQDTVFLLSFAIIMLNTDLHKVRPANGSRMMRKRMTKQEFLNNLRGVDSCEELTRDYLSNIYDSIEANPIAITEDLHLPRLPTTPRLCGTRAIEEVPNEDLDSLIKTMIQSVKPSEELLRGLSVHENPFHTVDDFCSSAGGNRPKVMRNLVRKTLSTTWYLFHAVINATLDKAHLDTQGMEYCLDVLKYALCATICMDMSMERSAFVTQLARFKVFAERRDEWFATRSLNAYKLEDWYINLEMDCADPLDEKAKLSALEQVHSIFEELHKTLRIDSGIKKDMHRAVRRIRNGGFLLNDPARSFLKEGDLMKRANRSGRTVMYRFFLFSDVLIYAKESSTDNDYKVHEELPLHLMKVVDYFPPSGKKHLKHSFEIHHPRKSFLVVAGSVEEKSDWVSTIRSAMEKEIQRKARLESARLTSSLHQWGG